MMMNSGKKKPLFRKVNTKARGVHHGFGTDFKDTKSTKREPSTKMKRNVKRGLDYTPLFKFLLSKVGKPYSATLKEATSRIEDNSVINCMVVSDTDKTYFRYGESTYYSTLYVDENGLLQVVDPNVNSSTLKPSCPCCTHTFNGLVFNKKFS